MKRSERRKNLAEIESLITASKKSISRIAYELTEGYDKAQTVRLKKAFKYIHPEDYKKQYPKAVSLLFRICYPKKRDPWGRLAELGWLEIKDIGLRKNEFIRRFRGLVRKYGKDEEKTLEIIDVLFSLKFSKEEKDILMGKIKETDTIYYDSIIMALSAN